jgi:hypothetical protein
LAVVTVALGLSVGKGRSPFAAGAVGPALALLSLLVFLIAAAATGGAATHHPERSLLPIFWFLALLTAGLITKLASEPQAWRLPALAVPLALVASLLLRPAVRGSFVDRREEEQVGSLLRGLSAQKVALDSDDFGFFAVQAALGHGKSWPLSDLDPRASHAPRPASTSELAARLRESGADWLVTTRQRQNLATPLGITRAATPRFVLVELDRQALARPR